MNGLRNRKKLKVFNFLRLRKPFIHLETTVEINLKHKRTVAKSWQKSTVKKCSKAWSFQAT